MAVKRKSQRAKLNTRLIIDSLIASVIVQQAPGLINNFLFKSNPLTGYTLSAASGAAAYLIGGLIDRPDVSSIGIALAGADIVNGLVSGLLPSGSPSVQDFVSLPALSEYTNNDSLTPQALIQRAVYN